MLHRLCKYLFNTTQNGNIRNKKLTFSEYEINVQYLIYCHSSYCDGLIQFLELEIYKSSCTMQNAFGNPLGICKLLQTALQGSDWWLSKKWVTVLDSIRRQYQILNITFQNLFRCFFFFLITAKYITDILLEPIFLKILNVEPQFDKIL